MLSASGFTEQSQSFRRDIAGGASSRCKSLCQDNGKDNGERGRVRSVRKDANRGFAEGQIAQGQKAHNGGETKYFAIFYA